jgi:hypothetical protein
VLAPEDPAIHEMTATILPSIDPPRALEAWREVARLAEARGDHRMCARGWAILGDLLSGPGGGEDAEHAWRKAIEFDPLQADALAGLAAAAGARNDHATAAELYERMRGSATPQHTTARHELQLARSLIVLGRNDDARSSLRRATPAGGDGGGSTRGLAEIAEATFDREHAAAEPDTAIEPPVDPRRPALETISPMASGCSHAPRSSPSRAQTCSIAPPARRGVGGLPARTHARAAPRPEPACDAARTMPRAPATMLRPSVADRRGTRHAATHRSSAPRCSSGARTFGARSARRSRRRARRSHESLQLTEDSL